MISESGLILVVEDDRDFAEILAVNLSNAGYDVAVASDGLSALRAFETESPALITLDLSLPIVSGFRLIHLFKRQRPDVPVIVVTALDFEEAEDAAWAGADDFVTKPLDPLLLVEKANHFLTTKSLPLAVAGQAAAGALSTPVGAPR